MLKTYHCGICKTKPDQISHHKSHLETEKHKDKRDLFELKLSKRSDEELLKEYGMIDVGEIVKEIETVMEDKKEFVKKNKKMILGEEEKNLSLDEEEKELYKQMEEYNLISNREALKDKIHEIHNYMRNHGVGYGMNALKVFNILYGLKKVEENGLFEKSGLHEDCRFAGLVKLANENKYEDLWSMIYNNVLDALNAHPQMRHFLFYEIPRNTSSMILPRLIKEIDNISKIEKSCNVQLSGKIYEYFIGRNKKDIEDLGAYFTDRHIVNYIYEKLNPHVKEDGTIHEMIDMFGGSGGFTTGYIHYLNKSDVKVVWETELQKVHHYDMNEDVIKSAGLEFFTLTGTLPKIGTHMGYKNSFLSNFDNKRFHYVVTNPPYGGDKNKKSEGQEKQEKIKKYIKGNLELLMKEAEKNKSIIEKRMKQLKMIENKEKQDELEEENMKVCLGSSSARIQKYAKTHNLKGNDKESVSLIQIMDMVDVGGTAVGVLKEGVFFDKKYKDIRRCLVQNFNVREVISIPQDQFENTTTKTSIVIFDNSEEKTSIVRFSELIVEKYSEDKFEEIDGFIALTESNGDICAVYDALLSEATIDELLENENVSLNGKDYNKKELMVSDEYELVKLGDICEFHKYKETNPDLNGNNNYYTCSNTIQKCNNGSINGEYIILGTRGSTIIDALHYYNGLFGCGKNMLIFNSDKYDNRFIYYILYGNKKLITNEITVSTIPMISMGKFKNINIPVPKSEAKMNEWVKKISTPYDEKIEKEAKIKNLEAYVRSRIVEISEKEECEEVELGKICEIKYGTRITKKESKGGDIPVYGGGDITFYTDKPNREKNTLIVSRFGVSEKCVRIIRNDFYLHDNGLSLNTIDKTIQSYINYIMISTEIQQFIYQKCVNKSIQGALNMDNFKNIKIKLPKNRDLIKALEPTFAEIEALQSDVKRAEAQYKAYIQELSKDAILGEEESKVEVQVPLTKEILEKQEGKKKKSTKSDTSSSISSKSSKSIKSSESIGLPCGFIKKDGCPCTTKGKSEYNGRCGTHKNK